MKLLRKTLEALIVVAFGGCASLPGQGPNVVDIALIGESTDGARAERAFNLVELTPGVIGAVGAEASVSIYSTFDGVVPETNVTQIGIGDRLAVRIWENSPDGLFSNAESKSSSFLAVVNQSGEIYIPYVGALYVVGLSLDAVRQRIADGLEGRAVDPEVVVLLEENGAQSIAVVGDTRSPGRFDIPASGLRLLDAVALAGGAREASFNTKVSIINHTNEPEPPKLKPL
ncbi:polysaccharide biosynthesis/export family protein [Candidatus Halocynthiibacter alkanivorans]|uniref:polysaccharide biosynthesis/export family protein n=1 Tax=Candidatus Halocynthiibacter alkanivorans TaxID=2267619 RepID=UPI00135C59D0|nr:polysaccharide biosynthesis/export family protein [Candidatus Halocynthiibacter alkanivorans]